ncbi:uncharacterized protein [Littorina saxatilis]|uniref:Uncharacterized protein n=1 Tax=Littorina saxatilis TaxID=31220 RepID=A0AAN9GAP1_9CAEN
MANERGMLLLLGTLLCLVVEDAKGAYCTTYNSGYLYTTYQYQYCAFGCCGSGLYEYCCTVSVGLIIGCVIGGLVVIGVIIAIVCCCVKQQSHSGRVVHPNTGVAVVSTGVHGQHSYNPYQPMPHQPHQPMGGMHHQPHQPMGGMPQQPYGGMPSQNKFPNAPPPAYNYSDPAYPPGGNANFPPNPPNAPDPFVAAAGSRSQPSASTSAGQAGGNNDNEKK